MQGTITMAAAAPQSKATAESSSRAVEGEVSARDRGATRGGLPRPFVALWPCLRSCLRYCLHLHRTCLTYGLQRKEPLLQCHVGKVRAWRVVVPYRAQLSGLHARGPAADATQWGAPDRMHEDTNDGSHKRDKRRIAISIMGHDLHGATPSKGPGSPMEPPPPCSRNPLD